MTSKQPVSRPDKIHMMIKRPKVVPSTSTRIRLNCGNLYVTVTRYKGRIFEVFATLGMSGQCGHSQMSALTTQVTIGIRAGGEPEPFIEHLIGNRCPTLSIDDGIQYFSCADAIGQVMKTELEKLKAGLYKEADANFNYDK